MKLHDLVRRIRPGEDDPPEVTRQLEVAREPR
jgi:hypothetical protein